MKKDLGYASLRSIELFGSLADEEIEGLKAHVTLRRFGRGEVILREEDSNRFMYAVLSGKVKVAKVSEDGRETILAFHGPGESFGELALIDGRTMPATVAATEDSAIALVARADFFEILYKNRKVLDSLLVVMSGRLRESWRRVEMLTFHHAADRVRGLLAILAEKHGLVGGEYVTISLKLTHQTIAGMTGLSRETVTRVLDGWIRSGEISVDEDRRISVRRGLLGETSPPG
jgi:CRP/FNR family transcriptional regulator